MCQQEDWLVVLLVCEGLMGFSSVFCINRNSGGRVLLMCVGLRKFSSKCSVPTAMSVGHAAAVGLVVFLLV